MNKIDFASESDIDDIMEFIDTYWKKGHILGTNREFFQYEHNINGEISYVISRDEQNHIVAILGYIPYGKKNRDVMTVMWKANHTEDPFLGVKLLQHLIENGNIRIAASPGINKKTRGIYQYLGYTVGVMTHWYRLCGGRTDFRIAGITDGEIPSVSATPRLNLIPIKDYSELEEKFDFQQYKDSAPKPYKEKWYIKKRYFGHPIYQYQVFGIETDAEKIETILIFRLQECSGSAALRLIDCIGAFDKITKITAALDELMIKYNAEYIDCYETGLKDEIFSGAGWKKVKKSANIIPNYFAPYVQENVDIHFFSTDADIVLFKGDGDQDRPNA